MFSSQLFSPELGDGHSAPSAVLQPLVQPPAPSWIQAGLEEMKRKSMKNRCCGFMLHLMDHPEDLDLVHSVLQAEFIAEGWLDAPAPLSAGGPFDPLLVAVKAAQSPKYPDPQHAAKLLDSQHAAKPQQPQLASSGSSEPRLVPVEPVVGLPPRPGPEHLLSFLWGVLLDIRADSLTLTDYAPGFMTDFVEPDAHHDTPEPDTRHDIPELASPNIRPW
ncbi:hypothetical protein GOODEAATRI_031561 [Goodea atripinnis]|uniref:Uncharacterized protein n=1 Tax=Goodea atripinnis TaxID=208336 RepID=A0ABV0PIR0_9TELE